ncbi:carbohydrate ABC transporter permease [Cellulosilyticum sp. I15G10I2]|uniref:carbohydrate ABC transporter permease n=1 Tax=Cellulosilyticum sp. I15G10I2 TaxID=1892843 RepID=UPI000B22861B|nr:sugar ABC transporter permease [Cellulosilyticum sp. I15G10I2]
MDIDNKSMTSAVTNKKTVSPRKGIKAFLYSQTAAPYVFISPFIIIFIVFFIYPVISTITMSFQTVLPGKLEFIGFENYKNLLNPTFFKAIRNSMMYTVLTLALLIPIPMILACFLNSKNMIGRNFFRSTLFIPALTSAVVATTIFRLIFGELPGSLMNQIIGVFGFTPIKWLKMQTTSFAALLILACWRWTGVNILYFLSGLQNIPQEVNESASLDGATTIQKFLYITMPMLRPITIYVLTISIYAGMAMFTESYMLFGSNKSPNDMGLTIIGYLYRQGWEQNNIGFGCAIGIVLLLFALVLNFAQLKIFGLFRKED